MKCVVEGCSEDSVKIINDEPFCRRHRIELARLNLLVYRNLLTGKVVRVIAANDRCEKASPCGADYDMGGEA